MDTINYEERVARGIALLDERVPDWVDMINLDRLDIRSGEFCVTAQIARFMFDDPHYATGMDYLGLENSEDYNDGSYTDHGFNVESWRAPNMPDGYDPEDGYGVLNTIWKREISARLESAQ